MKDAHTTWQLEPYGWPKLELEQPGCLARRTSQLGCNQRCQLGDNRATSEESLAVAVGGGYRAALRVLLIRTETSDMTNGIRMS